MNRNDVLNNNNIIVLAALGLLLFMTGGLDCDFTPAPTPTPQQVDRVTYVYEKDQNPVPQGVAIALQKINAATPAIIASEFEDDTTDGTGATPKQYAIALAAAKEAGIPALVVQAGDRVVKVVKSPTTEQHVTEALK